MDDPEQPRQRKHRADLDRAKAEAEQREAKRRENLLRWERYRQQREEELHRREANIRREAAIRAQRDTQEKARRLNAHRGYMRDLPTIEQRRPNPTVPARLVVLDGAWELSAELAAARAELQRCRREEEQERCQRPEDPATQRNEPVEVFETSGQPQRDRLPRMAWDISPQPPLPDIAEKRAEFEQIRDEMWERYGFYVYPPDAHEAVRASEAARDVMNEQTTGMANEKALSPEERREAYEAVRAEHRRDDPAGPEERRAAYEAARDAGPAPQQERAELDRGWER